MEVTFNQFISYFGTYYPWLVPVVLYVAYLSIRAVEWCWVMLYNWIDDFETPKKEKFVDWVEVKFSPLLRAADGVSMEEFYGPTPQALAVAVWLVMLMGLLLLLYALPVLTMGLGSVVALLFLARKVVRFGKKLKKHIKDPNAHKGT